MTTKNDMQKQLIKSNKISILLGNFYKLILKVQVHSGTRSNCTRYKSTRSKCNKPIYSISIYLYQINNCFSRICFRFLDIKWENRKYFKINKKTITNNCVWILEGESNKPKKLLEITFQSFLHTFLLLPVLLQVSRFCSIYKFLVIYFPDFPNIPISVIFSFPCTRTNTL